MENETWYWNPKLFNGIKFSFGVLSIICGIVLISTSYHQFSEELLESADPPHPELKPVIDPEPELFHPEIFIPQGIIQIILGLVLLFFLRWQIINEVKKKYLAYLSIALITCVILSLVIFIVNPVISHRYTGNYNVLSLFFSMIVAFTFICMFIFILLIRDKFKNMNRAPGSSKPYKKLLDYKVMDYRFVTAFLLAICVFSLYMIPIFSASTEPTNYHIYWEGGKLPEKFVLPGMNASYNLIVETRGGTTTFEVPIVEIERSGNWSVSSEKLIVKPNEKKIITFTNYVPANSQEEIYSFRFWIVYSNIFETETIETYSTLDMNLYNSSQTTNPSFLALNSSGIISSHSNEPFASQIMLGSFMAWIVIAIIFYMRKKRNK